MDTGLKYYKDFIDGLVEQKNGVEGKWILDKGYPNIEDNKSYNELLASLSPEQKEILAKLVQQARLGGIHDTLAYMNELMDCDGLVLSQNGLPFPHDEFESMHYDFICRCEGDDWEK